MEGKFKKAVNDGSIDKFTKPELREFCVLKELPDKGVKSMLVTIIKEYFDNWKNRKRWFKLSNSNKN